MKNRISFKNKNRKYKLFSNQIKSQNVNFPLPYIWYLENNKERKKNIKENIFRIFDDIVKSMKENKI